MQINARSQQKNHGKYFSAVFLLLFCLLFATRLGANNINTATPPDTSKVQYDINDPRNPDCPCHKYQEQAEEEYRRLQGENPQVQVQIQMNVPNDSSEQIKTNEFTNGGEQNSAVENEKQHNRNNFSFSKSARKKITRIKWRMSRRKNGTKNWHKRVADCFHWS